MPILSFLLLSLLQVLFLSTSVFASGATDSPKCMASPNDDGSYQLDEHCTMPYGGACLKGACNRWGYAELKDGRRLIFKDTQDSYSLVISYLASRVVNFISPGQAVRVVVVKSTQGRSLIGSFEIRGYQSGSLDQGEKSKLLHFALDLLGIEDRHGGNVGTIPWEGRRLAVAIDMDTYSIGHSWFQERISINNATREALDHMSKISLHELERVFSEALTELEKSAPGPLSVFPKKETLDQLAKTKNEMDWLHRHFDDPNLPIFLSRSNINNGWDLDDTHYNKTLEMVTDRAVKSDSDDYGILWVLRAKDLPLIRKLIAKGIKVSSVPLNIALHQGNEELINLYLDQKPERIFIYHIEAALHSRNYKALNRLLVLRDKMEYYADTLTDIKETKRFYLRGYFTADNNVFSDEPALEALNQKDERLVKLLVEHNVLSFPYLLLVDSVKDGDKEGVQQILEKGGKDFLGLALDEAVKSNSLEMVKLLLNHGAKDPFGWALKTEKLRVESQWSWWTDKRILDLLEKHSSEL